MQSSYKTLLRQGEDLYEVIAKVAVSAYIKNEQFLPDKVEQHKKDYNAEHVLHTPDHFIYLNRIEELTDVEYITDNGNSNIDSSSSERIEHIPDTSNSIPSEEEPEGTGKDQPGTDTSGSVSI